MRKCETVTDEERIIETENKVKDVMAEALDVAYRCGVSFIAIRTLKDGLISMDVLSEGEVR